MHRGLSFKIQNHAEYKLAAYSPDLTHLAAQIFLQWQHWEQRNCNNGAQGWSSGVREHLSLEIDAPTCSVPTDLNVSLLVSSHLSEAERRDVTPHAKSLGDASPRVTGIYQVCWEGEQPAQKKNSSGSSHKTLHTFLC